MTEKQVILPNYELILTTPTSSSHFHRWEGLACRHVVYSLRQRVPVCVSVVTTQSETNKTDQLASSHCHRELASMGGSLDKR